MCGHPDASKQKATALGREKLRMIIVQESSDSRVNLRQAVGSKRAATAGGNAEATHAENTCKRGKRGPVEKARKDASASEASTERQSNVEKLIVAAVAKADPPRSSMNACNVDQVDVIEMLRQREVVPMRHPSRDVPQRMVPTDIDGPGGIFL